MKITKSNLVLLIIGAILILSGIISIASIPVGSIVTILIGCVLIVIAYIKSKAGEGFSQTQEANENNINLSNTPVVTNDHKIAQDNLIINNKRGNVNTFEHTDIDLELSEKLSDRFIAFDVETTGLSKYTDRIIQIGAIVFENHVEVKRYCTLINPQMPIPDNATRINHITNNMVVTAPTEYQEIFNFVSFLGNAINGETVIVAYNADFDMGFLSEMFKRNGVDATINYVDALKLSRKYFKGLDNYQQITVASFLDLDTKNAHSADADAEICGKILIHLLPKIEEQAKKKKRQLEDKQPSLEEKGICAYITKLIKETEKETERLRFEKRSGGMISILHPYKFASFKIPKNKPIYFIFDNRYFVKSKIDLDSEPTEYRNGQAWATKVFISSLNDIDLLLESILKGYNEVSESINDYYRHKKWVEQYEETSFRIEDEKIEDLIQQYHETEAEKRRIKEERLQKEAEKKAQREQKRIDREKRETEKAQKINDNSATTRPVGQYDDDMNLIAEYDSVTAAAKAVNINTKSIREVAKGNQKHAAGYVWKYLEKDDEPKCIQEE